MAGPILKQKLWPSGRAQRGVFFTCFYTVLLCLSLEWNEVLMSSFACSHFGVEGD